MYEKKIEKFLKKKWKNSQTCCILWLLCTIIVIFTPEIRAGENREEQLARELQKCRADLAKQKDRVTKLTAEIDFLRNENSMQRRELIETLDKYSTQAGNLRRIEKGVAGTIETLEPAYINARAMELADDFHLCISILRKLSGEVMNFTDEAGKRLPELITDNVELARMRLRLDSLRNEAVRGAETAASVDNFQQTAKCQILEKNLEWKLVILTGGYRNGIRTGMVLEAGKVRLKVIAVRSFISAAIVIAGKFDDLAVGQWTAAILR